MTTGPYRETPTGPYRETPRPTAFCAGFARGHLPLAATEIIDDDFGRTLHLCRWCASEYYEFAYPDSTEGAL